MTKLADDDTPLTRNIRTLENRLDKAMIKYNEAQVRQQIKQTACVRTQPFHHQPSIASSHLERLVVVLAHMFIPLGTHISRRFAHGTICAFTVVCVYDNSMPWMHILNHCEKRTTNLGVHRIQLLMTCSNVELVQAGTHNHEILTCAHTNV